MKIFRHFSVLSFALLMSSLAFAAVDQTALKESMMRDLDTIRGVFQVQYAPTSWKSQFSGWSVDAEIDKAKDQIKNTANITVKDFQKILTQFFLSMKDYHVSISYFSTEAASLPLTIKGAEGRYFLAYIDRTKLTEAAFPFAIGDEVIAFDNKPVADEIAKLLKVVGHNVSETDNELAMLNLTKRSASRGYDVPQGPVNLSIKSKAMNKIYTYQLMWTYTPEKISPLGLGTIKTVAQTVLREGRSTTNTSVRSKVLAALNAQMLSPYAEENPEAAAKENPFNLGSRKSFIPRLGSKIWESQADDIFDAYIFKNEKNQLIGYLRIPSYTPDDADDAIAELKKIVARFELNTEGMVIDQVNNPGGSVFYLYALAGLLSDQALRTPQHRMTINQSQVFNAATTLPELEKVTNDDEAKKALGESLSGYETSYQVAQFLIRYFRFLTNEWNAGRTITEPSYIAGVDQINPNLIRYTKPILLITNPLDFSGGDFFPAIMQDNKRVTVFGARTAGAGGYVLSVNYPNQFGIQGFRLTGSIAERLSMNPIENLGVTPDKGFDYSLTASDYENNFADYVKAILGAVAKITN